MRHQVCPRALLVDNHSIDHTIACPKRIFLETSEPLPTANMKWKFENLQEPVSAHHALIHVMLTVPPEQIALNVEILHLLRREGLVVRG